MLTLSTGMFYICSHSDEGPAMSSQAATALAFFNQQKPENNWPDPDLSVLDDRRAPVPAVPLGLLPEPWRDWIAETERASGAPADYVLPSVLAGVAAVSSPTPPIATSPAGRPATGWSTRPSPNRENRQRN
jgi:hypothetical protein